MVSRRSYNYVADECLHCRLTAYGKQDPAMPFNLIPPTLGGTPRKAASQLSTSSRRSLSADNLPTAHSFRSSSSLSSRGPDTPRDSLSVHERMLSRHKQEASKYGASLVQVDKPSGQLPSPTLAKAQSHSVLPPMGAHHGMGQPLAFGPAVATDQPPPGIDPQLWATLAPDQRLNLSMRNNVSRTSRELIPMLMSARRPCCRRRCSRWPRCKSRCRWPCNRRRCPAAQHLECHRPVDL